MTEYCKECEHHSDLSNKVSGMWETRWLIITIILATYGIFYLVMDNAFAKIEANKLENIKTSTLVQETNINLQILMDNFGIQYRHVAKGKD